MALRYVPSLNVPNDPATAAYIQTYVVENNPLWTLLRGFSLEGDQNLHVIDMGHAADNRQVRLLFRPVEDKINDPLYRFVAEADNLP